MNTHKLMKVSPFLAALTCMAMKSIRLWAALAAASVPRSGPARRPMYDKAGALALPGVGLFSLIGRSLRIALDVSSHRQLCDAQRRVMLIHARASVQARAVWALATREYR